VDYINYLCYKELTGKTISYYEYTFEDHPDNLEFDWEPIPVFWRGAKIIFTKNDRIDVEANGQAVRVTNGTVGEVIGFNEDLVRIKSYDDGSEFYIEGDYDTIKLAYAMTVYKSQGSEAQYVIYFHSNHIFETKRLAYTAMTRAQTNVKIYTPFDGFQMSKDVDRITNINSQ
jgi:ATP-dependent exoDNAse (exonuclease V) alpha subunit